MFSLQEFGELRYLWLKYSLELKRCHTYVKKDGKMVPTGIDSECMKRYYKRIVAVDRALSASLQNILLQSSTLLFVLLAVYSTLMLLPDTTVPE